MNRTTIDRVPSKVRCIQRAPRVERPRYPSRKNINLLLDLIPQEYSLRCIIGGPKGLASIYANNMNDTLVLLSTDLEGKSYELGREDSNGDRTGVWSRWNVENDYYSVSTWRHGVQVSDWAPQPRPRLVKAACR